MPTTIRVSEEVFDMFDSIKKRLEKKAQLTDNISPKYSQSDIVKILCLNYKLNEIAKTVNIIQPLEEKPT